MSVKQGQGYVNDVIQECSYFLPMNALMLPLPEYIIKLIPSLFTFRSKDGQTLTGFTQTPMWKVDSNLYVCRNSLFSPKLQPGSFLKNKYFVDECLPYLQMQQTSWQCASFASTARFQSQGVSILYNWPPSSKLLLNNSLLELIYFLNKMKSLWLFFIKTICTLKTVFVLNLWSINTVSLLKC